MESYYDAYFGQGRGPAPGNDGDDQNNTHYQASSMMQNQNGNRYNNQKQNQYQQQPSDDMYGAAQGSNSPGQSAPMTNAKIYVSNMPTDCDERKLTEIFSRYGEICSVTHKGSYAFVEYSEPAMATDAIAEMKAGGTQMRVQLAFSQGNRGGGYQKQGGGNGFGTPGAAGGKYGGNSMGGGGGGPGAGGSTNTCFKCGEDGHWASSCPMNGGMGRGQPGMGPSTPNRSGTKCYNCQDSGHWARECPKPSQRGGGNFGGRGGGRGGGYGGNYGGGYGGGNY